MKTWIGWDEVWKDMYGNVNVIVSVIVIKIEIVILIEIVFELVIVIVMGERMTQGMCDVWKWESWAGQIATCVCEMARLSWADSYPCLCDGKTEPGG